MKPIYPCSRRQWLIRAAAGIPAAWLAGGSLAKAAAAPALPVSVAKCQTYDPAALVPTLSKMFDQLGGLGRLVKGKTVAIKINLTGDTTYRLGYLPAEDTHYTHPAVIAATVHLMGRAGARRVRILESPWSTADPIEEVILQANWEPRDILGAAPTVEFENTNYLGRGKTLRRGDGPAGGPYMFPGFDLNHSYARLRRLRQPRQDEGARYRRRHALHEELLRRHALPRFMAPGAGVDEPSLLPKGGRDMVHSGSRQPSRSALPEVHPPRRAMAATGCRARWSDLISARPIHLAIVEGIRTMAGGEGPWIRGSSPIRPGVIVAGPNPVNTDAVCMSVMGFDPMADARHTALRTLRQHVATGGGTRRGHARSEPHRCARNPHRGGAFRLREIAAGAPQYAVAQRLKVR